MSIWRRTTKIPEKVIFKNNFVDTNGILDFNTLETITYINKIIIKEINDLKYFDLNNDNLKFPGIYILKKSNIIKYIGSSRYLFREIKYAIKKYENKFNEKIESIDACIINNYKDAEFIEHYLINVYKPCGNRMIYKTPTLTKQDLKKLKKF